MAKNVCPFMACTPYLAQKCRLRFISGDFFVHIILNLGFVVEKIIGCGHMDLQLKIKEMHFYHFYFRN